MNPDLLSIAPGLRQEAPGYWVADRAQTVSYPSDGNEHLLPIEDRSFWFRHRNAVIVDMVRMYPPEGPIFDIGGGNGYVAQGIESAGYPCVVVEPGPTGAANARKRGLKAVVHSTVESAQFRPGSLPAVGLFDVLEHIEDEHPFLARLREILKPGGRIYLTVPAYRGLWSTDDDYAQHHRRYTTTTLKRSLMTAGFSVDCASPYFVSLSVPLFLFRSLPSRFGFRKKAATDTMAREHELGSGPLGLLVNLLLRTERRLLKAGRVLPFGSSCIAVGHRPIAA